jgi:hypothetical protein
VKNFLRYPCVTWGWGPPSPVSKSHPHFGFAITSQKGAPCPAQPVTCSHEPARTILSSLCNSPSQPLMENTMTKQQLNEKIELLQAEFNEQREGTSEAEMEFNPLAGLDLVQLGCKIAIGYVYIALGWIAVTNVGVMLMLLTSAVWLQYIIAFAVLATGLVALIKTAPFVTDVVYNGGAFVGAKIKAGYDAAKFFFAKVDTKVVDGFTVAA